MIINWPHLTDSDIETRAAEFRDAAIQALDYKGTASVPVEQIAEIYLGYEFEFVEDDDALPGDVIGGIDFDSKTIIINAAIEDHIGRYSFTIAHEIAHHVLHRNIFLKAQSDQSIMCRGGVKRPIEEVQADRFAEALLMPRDVVCGGFKSVRWRRSYSRRGRLALASKVIQSTGLINVSVAAMEMRLLHLGLVSNFNLSNNPVVSFLYRKLKRR